MLSDERIELPVAVGDIVADKYRVERMIGRGGMGTVFQATHVQLLQRVALKFLSGASVDDTDRATRFLREARAAAALTSEHVARVLDVGVLGSGIPYLVIELLEGEDLGTRLREATLPLDETIDLMMQACDALGEAHRIGIVHRDIKPHNLFLVRRPNGTSFVKVLDFGIAKSTDAFLSVEEGLTDTCAVMGTPRYMAPEQMTSSRTVDARADVWALGVCLYQCLTGKLPFETTNMLELGAMVLAGSPTPVTQQRPDLPPAVVAVIDRCLSKDPSHRFADATELRAALAAAKERATLVAAPQTLVSASSPQPSIAIANAPPDRAAPRVSLSVVALCLLGTLVIAAFVAKTWRSTPAPSDEVAVPLPEPVPVASVAAPEPEPASAPPLSPLSPPSTHASAAPPPSADRRTTAGSGRGSRPQTKRTPAKASATTTKPTATAAPAATAAPNER